MPRPRSARNKHLPKGWAIEHGAYFYSVPLGLESLWGGKRRFRLGTTLPEAYKVWAERVGRNENARTVADLLDSYAAEVVPLKAAKSRLENVRHVGYKLDGTDDPYSEAGAKAILELLDVFSNQGHSGFSANYVINAFNKLARFEPLAALTGADDEWTEVSDGVFQNNRCSHVFKQADRFDGKAYDLNGRIFREPDGSCYTGRDSMVPIVFPYTPTSEYVDVPASTPRP